MSKIVDALLNKSKVIACTSFFHMHHPVAKRFSIAMYAPRGFRDLPVLRIFVPDADLVKHYHEGLITDKQYTELYLTPLRKQQAGLKAVVKQLAEYPGNVELCCWETRSKKFCHRQLVANIINSAAKTLNLDIEAVVYDLDGK